MLEYSKAEITSVNRGTLDNTDVREYRYCRMQLFESINFDADRHAPRP